MPAAPTAVAQPAVAPVPPLLERPWVKAISFGGEPLPAVLDRQVRIALKGSGPYASRELVPETTAARQALAGADGQRIRDEVRGIASFVDGQKGKVWLEGVSFAVDRRGVAANALYRSMKAGEIDASAPTERFNQSATQFAGGILNAYDSIAASWGAGWIDISDKFARPVVRDEANNPVTPVQAGVIRSLMFRHEAEHGITPGTKSAFRENGRMMVTAPGGLPVNWLEEGTAQVLTQWPGQLDRSIRALKMPGSEREAATDPMLSQIRIYDRYTSAMAGLLEIAGVDTASPAAYSRANELLQGKSVRYTAGRLARAMIDTHHLPERSYEPLRQRILDVKGDPARLVGVARYVAEHAPLEQ